MAMVEQKQKQTSIGHNKNNPKEKLTKSFSFITKRK